jgi:hypothetical protein
LRDCIIGRIPAASDEVDLGQTRLSNQAWHTLLILKPLNKSGIIKHVDFYSFKWMMT